MLNTSETIFSNVMYLLKKYTDFFSRESNKWEVRFIPKYNFVPKWRQDFLSGSNNDKFTHICSPRAKCVFLKVLHRSPIRYITIAGDTILVSGYVGRFFSTHLKIVQPYMKSTGAWSTNQLQFLAVPNKMGKFDWGVRYVIIFLYVQVWIRLGIVSYRGKKVRTVDSPAVRSVNKSRDTRNCVQNEPKYAICVLVATRLYYKALGIILCALI